jgi:undecaprenyl-diphosphatase
MLEHLDQQFFLFLNSLHTSFLDPVMYALSGKLIWAPLYAAILTYIAIKEKNKFWFILLFILVAVILADQSSNIIKFAVKRLRPCHEPALEGMVHMVGPGCGGAYGFVSSHAANSFNVALISLLFVRKRWFTICIIIWASVVGYSRIYLGVHYPGDVICGSIVGALVGWGVYHLYVYAENKREIKQGRKILQEITGNDLPAEKE